MKAADDRASTEPRAERQRETSLEPPLYTRYCAAPPPAHPVGEPRLLHTMLIATWLGRLIDPLPHKDHPAKASGA